MRARVYSVHTPLWSLKNYDYYKNVYIIRAMRVCVCVHVSFYIFEFLKTYRKLLK